MELNKVAEKMKEKGLEMPEYPDLKKEELIDWLTRKVQFLRKNVKKNDENDDRLLKQNEEFLELLTA